PSAIEPIQLAAASGSLAAHCQVTAPAAAAWASLDDSLEMYSTAVRGFVSATALMMLGRMVSRIVAADKLSTQDRAAWGSTRAHWRATLSSKLFRLSASATWLA